MRTWFGVLVLATLTAASLVGCQRQESKRADAVLATVDGVQITESTFQKEAQNLPPAVRPLVTTPSGRAQFVDSLIVRELLLREALRRGIERRPEVRDRLEQARRSILLETLLRDVSDNAAAVSDNAVRAYYEKNKAEFATGERVRVRHIVFAKKDVAEIIARKAKKGTPFKELMQISQMAGATAADLGLIERGAYDKAFEKAVFGAPANSIVGPVKTAYGYHVIQVLDKRPAGVPAFEEVKDKIAAELKETTVRGAFDSLVTGLKKQAEIHVTTPLPENGVDGAASPPGDGESPASGGEGPGGGR